MASVDTPASAPADGPVAEFTAGRGRRVLLIGSGDLPDEVNAALGAAGAEVAWLAEPEDEALRDALDASPDAVAVVARDDAFPIRMALLVRHLDDDVPMVVTIFDPEMAQQVSDCVPHCRVTSLADIVAPSLAGPCIEEDIAAVLPEGDRIVALHATEAGEIEERPLPPLRVRHARALFTAVFRPYDTSAALLFYGLMGLLAILLFETVGAMIVLDQGAPDAIYGGVKSLATVGPNEAVSDGPKWFKVAVAASTLAAVISAAAFTGGLINRLVDTRLTGLVGRRAMPRGDHVVVVGLGQVGLRLCLLLRSCGVPVVAVDTEADGENVGLARRAKLPVVIGRGANPVLLRRLSLGTARAFAAVTPDDLVNVQAAMAARSVNPDLRVVLRAGDGAVAEETRSLQRIGHVRDVHRIGATLIAAAALGVEAESAVCTGDHAQLLLADGQRVRFPLAVLK